MKEGRKMITVSIKFWTNDIGESGEVEPKEAWSSGVAYLESNPTHGIDISKGSHFTSLTDVGSAIEKELVKQNVLLHPNTKMRKLIK